MFNTDDGLCPTCGTLLHYLFGAQYYCPNECDKPVAANSRSDRENSPVPGFLVGDKILHKKTHIGLGQVVGFGPSHSGTMKLCITYANPNYPGWIPDVDYYLELPDIGTRLRSDWVIKKGDKVTAWLRHDDGWMIGKPNKDDRLDVFIVEDTPGELRLVNNMSVKDCNFISSNGGFFAEDAVGIWAFNITDIMEKHG